ncbi:ATP-dependent Clp protease ATP-binding subunit ClpX [Lacrimispora sp. NSJ-141]|uniref:ATP-dependent Clp protease ATP-binding subunit ClpX n=2 Tax=Lientehia hominis TaxID=2897778 RepID=A0AAP2RI01_9FIRM|nr:ATP-dependent Clp protease ATP-binding subunit ClpX [Lientehia hominis]MCD2492126.1 ATP-dependent Clp protease ATP-binding subunit ClpX [Lientehia hominis]
MDIQKEDVSDAAAEKAAQDDDDDYEKICCMCHRPESKAGKMITMPGGIVICSDCMQKAFDTFDKNGSPYGVNVNIPGNGQGGLDLSGLSNMPGVGVINLADLGLGEREIPKNQKVKKRKVKDEKPKFDRQVIPAPHKIKKMLDEYVVGQEKAKKAISVAVYNHYKRVGSDNADGVEIEKSNMLLLGPTGSGKTYLVKTLAKLLDVPLAIADATSLTEAGYIGDDIESVVSKLLAAAGNDVEKAERGIIYIDEIDKIAKKRNTNTRDVSGESVQQELLKMLEGSEVEVPVGANSKNAMVPMTTVNTTNILFICGGAFPDLEEIIKERLTKESSIGFKAELKDKYDKEENLLCRAEIDDLRKFGMIPEFLGRLPVLVSLEALTKEFLVRILKEPRNAILKQYEKLLQMDEVQLLFEDEALEAIAEKAMEKHTGARALRAILEEYMLDIMYEIPKDDNIGRVTITRAYIEKTGGPIIDMRGVMRLGVHA